MDRAESVATKSHGIPGMKSAGRWGDHARRGSARYRAAIPALGKSKSTLAHAVQELRKERDQAPRRIEQLD